VTNITFIFEASPNAKPKEKKVGGTWHIVSPPAEKVGGYVPRIPHQIAPMFRSTQLLFTNLHFLQLYNACLWWWWPKGVFADVLFQCSFLFSTDTTCTN